MASTNVDAQAILDRSSTKAVTALLARLDQTLYDPASTRRLRTSNLERTKVGANIEYARTRLLRIEQERQPSDRGKRSDVEEKKAHVKKLQDRLYELSQLVDGGARGDDSSSESEVEDILRRYAPARKNVSNGIDREDHSIDTAQSPGATTTAAAANLSSTLRARRADAGTTAENTATTTGSFAARKPDISATTPFAPRSEKQQSISPNSDTLLAHHSSEQEALTDSLLQLATALKNSTLSFSQSLESSNSIVDQAAAALDRNITGMEAAGKRLGVLRKMTEGWGLFKRFGSMGVIAFLWVVLFLVMFVMPKLRF